MSYSINSFFDHIPPKLLESNREMVSLVEILDNMREYKNSEIVEYERSFVSALNFDPVQIKRALDGWDAEYTSDMPLLALKKLYENYRLIYGSRGTDDSIIVLLQCLFIINADKVPVVRITKNSSLGLPLILFDSSQIHDYIPNADDIYAEISSPVGKEHWCPTLLDGSWDYQRSEIRIEVDIDYKSTKEFEEFVVNVLYHYIPMINKDFYTIHLKVNYYAH